MASPVTPEPAASSALIVVDVQRDFLPNGALAVLQGDGILPILQQYVACFHAQGLPIIATRDWHPSTHCSFESQGGRWPVHCVQQTTGAEIHPALKLPANTIIISKATEPAADAYSGFQGTDLAERLHAVRVRTLYIGGLATDYCVKETVFDGLRAGFEVILLRDGCRAVNITPHDGERAIAAMITAGASSMTLEDLPRVLSRSMTAS